MFRKKTPRPNQLAVRTGNWVGKYGPSVGQEHGYWKAEEERWDGTSNMTAYNIARGMHDILHHAGNLLTFEMAKGNFDPI